jgi:hypothetical protein
MPAISLQEFKDYRQITGTDTARDNRITFLINAVIARAQRYTGKTFDSGAIAAEDHNYNPSGVYWLKATPITVAPTVKYVSPDGSTVALPTSAYRYDDATGQVQVYSNVSLWDLGYDSATPFNTRETFRTTRFAYTGGGTAPDDLKLALLQMVDDLYTANASGQGRDRSLQSVSLGAMAYTFRSDSEWAALERKYLKPFQRGGFL